MKSFTKILALSMIFLFSSSIYAQFDLGEKFEEIKKKIDKEVEKTIDDEVDKTIDDAIDETAETIKKGGKNKTEDESQTTVNKNKESETKVSPKTAGVLTPVKSFEGKVIFNVESDGEQQVIEYYSKDNKYLMEMPETGGSILFDSHQLKMYMIIHKEKIYMETPMTPMGAEGGGSFSKTGETKNILGYECEKFRFTQKDRSGVAWMTDELGAFMFFMGVQKEMSEWKREILEAGYFPMHVAEYDEDGNVESVFSVKVVTPMELNSDLFVIPSAYKKLDLMNMFGQ